MKVAPFVLNIAGSTGTGKSITATAAMTMYGKTDASGEGTLCTSGSSSYSGICGILDFCQDFPFFIDEIQNSNDENVTKLIYEVGNPGSTYKGLQQGGVRFPTSSRSVVIVTGEIDTASKLQFDGAGNRLIVVDSSPLEGLGKTKSETAVKAQAIEDLMKDHYGHVGPEYVEYIRQMITESPQELQDIFESAKLRLIKDGSTLHNRQFSRYAAALVGCELLGRMLSAVDRDLGRRLQEFIIRHWANASESRVDSSVSTRALNVLFGFVATHSEYFSKVVSGPSGEKYGQIQNDGCLALEPEALGRIIFKNGFDLSNVEKMWLAEGLLKITPSASGRGSKSGKIKTRDRGNIGKLRIPCVILKKEIVEKFIPHGL